MPTVLLSVALALVVASGWAAGDGSLARARAAFARSDYETARKLLGEVGDDSRGAAALLRARLELHTGRYAEAAKSARAAGRRSKAARIAAAPWLAEALVRQGKLKDAIGELEAVSAEDDAHRARLLLGELYIRSGRRADAREPLMSLIRDYNQDVIKDDDPVGLTLVGRAAHLLRSAHDANDAFNQAERAGGAKRVETLLARAELYLDKYDPGHAAEVVEEASKRAPGDPRVRVAMAQVKLAQSLDFAAAEEEVDQALRVDGRLAEAFFVRAGLALRTMDLPAAERAADAGLVHDPRNLELLSIKAAAKFLGDDAAGFEALKKQVLRQNPQYSHFFQIVGEFAEWEHRYDEIVAMMREAIAIDDRDAKAYATLGLNLIRGGHEQAGLEALQKAWRRDKFNVRVFNTLNLYEKTIAKEYVTVDGTTFRIRYHKDEKAVLERYAPAMLEEAWTSMVERYGFKPTTPVGIELYAHPEHFAVRTSGLPNIGIQGVCFGKTLATLSPTAAGFNWGMVLWHELSHVFAIQLSKNRVPRWFTEGLSEYETIARRREWRREEDESLYRGLRSRKIPKVAAFNRAFTHVRRPEEVTMAYFAASQILVFMVEQFGFTKVVAALPQWAEGKRTDEVIRRSFGVAADELDRRFRAWLEPRLERYRKQYVPNVTPPDSLEEARKRLAANPTDPGAYVEVALGLLAAGKRREAESTLALALQRDPRHADALYLSLRLALGAEDLDRAAAFVSRLRKAGHDGYAVRMKAADIAEARKKKEEMRNHLWAAHRFDPSQAEPLQALYDLFHEDKDVDGELSALRLLAQIDQHDRRVWRRLLQRLVERGKWEEARAVGESAIFVDVHHPETHQLYARALARSRRHVSAIFELNSAILAGAEPPAAAAIYRSMAEGYRKLGREDYAAKAEQYAERMAARTKR
ncbi:MAG: tetratricopeptide repeat protein [Deltaproteobacteria bacterium]|nr:tetratricopeptide repeat protein [Deltaproteobacteria bacterium]MBW2531509.1 tetratricopeptide repeat protein [Deltaproteobacteria bacterium]